MEGRTRRYSTCVYITYRHSLHARRLRDHTRTHDFQVQNHSAIHARARPLDIGDCDLLRARTLAKTKRFSRKTTLSFYIDIYIIYKYTRYYVVVARVFTSPEDYDDKMFVYSSVFTTKVYKG